jgi:hypothetical protein
VLRALLVFALTLVIPVMLRAQPVSSLNELGPAGQAAGQARLRFWGLDVYDASLVVAPGFRQGDFASHGFALQLHYLRSFTGADIAQRSLEEMRRVGGFSATQAGTWQSALARLLPDVSAGDRITGVNRPGRPALFLHNGRPLGEVGDAQFARLFFGIWLAPQTSEPALRAALLAGAER